MVEARLITIEVVGSRHYYRLGPLAKAHEDEGGFTLTLNEDDGVTLSIRIPKTLDAPPSSPPSPPPVERVQVNGPLVTSRSRVVEPPQYAG